MKELLNERLSEENIIKLVSNYDNKFSKLEKENKEKNKEIERLNNIINKLEIDIEIGVGKYEYDTNYNRGLSDAFIYMNERLQELKNNKEFVPINKPTLTTSSTSGNRRRWYKSQTRSSDEYKKVIGE